MGVQGVTGLTEAHITAITQQWDGEAYFAGNGRDNPSSVDGNGFDCSGWDHWLGEQLAARGHYGGTYPMPLGSTSTYSRKAREQGWLVARTDVIAGDTLIYAENDDPENSDGAAGHVGRVVRKELRDGVWWVLTSESRGGQGVGLYWRQLMWWTIAYRIPDSLTSQEDGFMAALTEAEQRKLYDNLETLVAFKDEITTGTDKVPWGGALLKLADLHRGWTAFKKGWKNSGVEPTDEQLTGRVHALRNNVASILKAVAPAQAQAPGD